MRGGLFDVYRAALQTLEMNEGDDWRFAYLQPSHPIYHSVIDRSGMTGTGIGLMVGDRMAALLGYLGVNSVVFALTQEGSVTRVVPAR